MVHPNIQVSDPGHLGPLVLFSEPMVINKVFIIHDPAHHGVQRVDMAIGAGMQFPIPGLHIRYNQTS